MERPMLGGCCVCLDERGWAENPLVYCDGQLCTVAVHQACYGIVDVPSGPWFCRKCELGEQTETIKCDLCPHQEGALKKADSGGWAHVVCALYIPEVEFGNVSTMEPIVLCKIPQERFDKECYICEEKGSSKKGRGACMDCAKVGCKLSFHVTCAQISGLLCEEAGSSNTTKYCGYCAQHLSKGKRSNPFKSLTCSKVYKLSPSPKETPLTNERCVTETFKTQEESFPQASSDVIPTPAVVGSQNCPSFKTEENNLSGPDALSTLAEAATCAIELERKTEPAIETNKVKTPVKKKRPNTSKGIDSKKLKRKTKKQDDVPTKVKMVKPVEVQEKLSPSSKMSTLLEDVGYAVAPKHSVVCLSSFGDASIIPSEPADIGKPKLVLLAFACTNLKKKQTVFRMISTNSNNQVDGLTAIEHLVGQQRNDVLQFFQEFGSPEVAPVLDALQHVREQNAKLESTIDKLAHRRDQLLALKAKLSIPFKNNHISSGVVSNAEIRIDNKPFSQP